MCFVAVAGIAYAAGVVAARRHGRGVGPWPVVAFYVLGLGSYALLSFGFFGVYAPQLRWVFATRLALVLFAVPWLLSLGRPAALAERALTGRPLEALHAFWHSPFMRVFGFAVFEPIFTLALLVLLITPIGGVMRTEPAVRAVLDIGLPAIGLLMVVPLAEDTRRHTSMYLSMEFLLAFAALVADAIPGIVLRLTNTVLDGVPAVIAAPAWFQTPIQDQHLAGDIIWCLAEVADLPVIMILFVRWLRHDRGEARSVDALTDEELDELNRQHLQGWH